MYNSEISVRNTFLHLSNSRSSLDEDLPRKCRSQSATPTCRAAKPSNIDCESDASTTCLTHSAKATSSFGEIDDASPTPEGSCKDQNLMQSSTSGDQEETTEEQIERMSQRVLEIWTKLRTMEGATTQNSAAVPIEGTVPVMWMPVLVPAPSEAGSDWRSAPSEAGSSSQELTRTPLKALRGQVLEGTTSLFVPSCKAFGNTHDYFASVKDLLMWATGVASVNVHLGAAGTLATVSIQLHANTSDVASVLTAAKSVLLEAAANSQSIYVLGYEAQPFTDVDGSSFAAMLAALPKAWHRNACWETYQHGFCPRGQCCKWQHPGKREFQPVRVTIS